MKSKFILALAMVGSVAFASYADGYQDGVEYFQAGQEDNAEIVLKKTFNEANTDKAVANYYLGRITLNKGDKAGADKYFDQGIQANPEYPYNYIGKGAVALKNNNKDAAEDFFKQAEKIDKKDAKIKVDIARAYYNADKVVYEKQWRKYIADAKKKDKKESSIYIFEGDVFADDGKYGDSAGYYEMAISFDEERPIAYVKYANTYFRINPEVAISKLSEIVEKNPHSALAQRELAEKYYENNQWTMAAQQYKNVVDNPNHFPKDEQRYVVLLYFDKKYEESSRLAKAQLVKNPKAFLMKRMLFLNAAALKNYQEAETLAIDFFQSAGKDDLFSSNDYTTYGDVLKELGKQIESLEAYTKAVEINPDKIELLKELSSQYSSAAFDARTQNDTIKTAEYYHKAADLFQKFIDKGEYSTNDLFVLAGRYQNVLSTAIDSVQQEAAFNKAIEVIDKVLERVPDDYRIMQRKARIQLSKEANDRSNGLAMESYKKLEEMVKANAEMDANKKNDVLKEAYNYYGSVYLAQKDMAAAVAAYEQYLTLEPENEVLKEYIANLKEKIED